MSILKSITSFGKVSKSSSSVVSGSSATQQSNDSISHGIAGAGGKRGGTIYWNKQTSTSSETFYTSGQESGGFGFAH